MYVNSESTYLVWLGYTMYLLVSRWQYNISVAVLRFLTSHSIHTIKHLSNIGHHHESFSERTLFENPMQHVSVMEKLPIESLAIISSEAMRHYWFQYCADLSNPAAASRHLPPLKWQPVIWRALGLGPAARPDNFDCLLGPATSLGPDPRLPSAPHPPPPSQTSCRSEQ